MFLIEINELIDNSSRVNY